jgi:chemotaxis protein MotA
MDLATLVGIVLAFISIFLGMTLEGTKITDLLLPPPFLIVIPSTIGVSLACGYLKDIPLIIAATKKAVLAKVHDGTETIEMMVKFAEKARREGLLALEEAVKEVDDPFMKKGIEMAVDGTDPEQLRDILEAEITAYKTDAKIPAKFHENAGGFAPTIGILGTVLSLVHIMHNLSDPGSLGPSISGAFIATLLGVGTANIIFLPISNKIKRQSEIDAHHMEVVVEGVLSIQAGSNPRVIQQKLSALMGITEKPEAKDKAA